MGAREKKKQEMRKCKRLSNVVSSMSLICSFM